VCKQEENTFTAKAWLRAFGSIRRLDTSGKDNNAGESEMDGGISMQYRIALPSVITVSIAVTRLP